MGGRGGSGWFNSWDGSALPLGMRGLVGRGAVGGGLGGGNIDARPWDVGDITEMGGIGPFEEDDGDITSCKDIDRA